jgi:hypothetical protein
MASSTNPRPGRWVSTSAWGPFWTKFKRNMQARILIRAQKEYFGRHHKGSQYIQECANYWNWRFFQSVGIRVYCTHGPLPLVDSVYKKELGSRRFSVANTERTFPFHAAVSLFTETRSTPLWRCCFLLVLVYLQYILSLKPIHLASAMLDNPTVFVVGGSEKIVG